MKNVINQFNKNLNTLFNGGKYSFSLYHHYDESYPFRLEIRKYNDFLLSVNLIDLSNNELFNVVSMLAEKEKTFFDFEIQVIAKPNKPALYFLRKNEFDSYKRINAQLASDLLVDKTYSDQVYSNRIAYIAFNNYIDLFTIRFD